MALADNRKMSILIGGFFLIGLIAGIFFSRFSEERKSSTTEISFSTQSVGSDAGSILETYTVVCPWSDEILQGGSVYLGNPLVDQAGPLVSIQQGLISENYTLYGPTTVGEGSSWKSSLIRQKIDSVVAQAHDAYGECIYSIGSTEVISLRQTIGNDCEATNTPYVIGLTCVE